MFVATVPKSPVFACAIGPMTNVASRAATPMAAIAPSTHMVFDVFGTVSRTSRPIPRNAMKKKARKQKSAMDGYGTGSKYCTHVVHSTEPAVKSTSPHASAPHPHRPARRAMARQTHNTAQPAYPRLAIQTSKKKLDVPRDRSVVEARYNTTSTPVTT